MREDMQNSRTNCAAIFVYSYFLTARHASHYRSHATITSPCKATPPALAQKALFLSEEVPRMALRVLRPKSPHFED